MSEENQEQQENGSKFTVNDRRHWVHEDENQGLEEAEEQLPSYVAQLKSDADEKDKRLREYIAAYKEKSAEIEEIKNRLQRENEGKLDQFKAKLFSSLLPILDNLKRANESAKNPGDFDSLKQGIQMTQAQFQKELQDNGVEPIQAVGQKFDPTNHEACMTVPASDPSQDNTVLEELEPGYMLGEKLIRPAKVKVAKANS